MASSELSSRERFRLAPFWPERLNSPLMLQSCTLLPSRRSRCNDCAAQALSPILELRAFGGHDDFQTFFGGANQKRHLFPNPGGARRVDFCNDGNSAGLIWKRVRSTVPALRVATRVVFAACDGHQFEQDVSSAHSDLPFATATDGTAASAGALIDVSDDCQLYFAKPYETLPEGPEAFRAKGAAEAAALRIKKLIDGDIVEAGIVSSQS